MDQLNHYTQEDLNSSEIWINFMIEGDFEEAWKFSDKVLHYGHNRDYDKLPRHYQCIWDGTPLTGKRVLICCYHGLGDTIQFIRYAPLVKKIAKEVIVWAQPSLLGILKTVEGIDKLMQLHDGEPLTEYDVDLEIMELPHIFRTTLHSIPLHMPYLNLTPIHLPKQKNGPSVGVVWQAGNWNQLRNVPYSLISLLSEVEDVNFFILQAFAKSAGWKDDFGIYPGELCLYNYCRVVGGLDLMITVDSMPAHMAGALNVPVWVLLHSNADWRWMENRTDSPWYPSMKLFRQQKPDEWETVIQKVIFELTLFRNHHLIEKKPELILPIEGTI